MHSSQLTIKRTIGYLLFDTLALLFIFLVPAISHLLNFPLYLIEPMRIVLILALAHTTRRNAYIIALTLPLFSYLISAHPVFYKMLLISGELTLNVWLFYTIFGKIRHRFVAILSSIVLSKALYYLAKFVVLALILKLAEGIVTTPLYIQSATTVVFSVYLSLAYKKES
ncbi:MAG TPA: hypothetical protein PKL52_04105 [Tenuifilaceae bacterium]|nr:hypothetical protein [Tenuifilaceae bacterium]